MVILLKTIKSSLAELDLGLKGILTMSETMESLMFALSTGTVPNAWALAAYPSLRPLSSWVTNLLARATQLAEWTSNFSVPKSVWLPGNKPSLYDLLHKIPCTFVYVSVKFDYRLSCTDFVMNLTHMFHTLENRDF